jgi:hypothetical protein
MRASRRVRLFAVLGLLLAPPASAWAPETRVRMVDEAVRFMPAGLRLALERHREPLLRGALGPLAREDDAAHRAPWSGGSLERTIEAEAHALVVSLGQPTPFAELASRFGVLAHYVLDAGFPPGIGHEDSGRRYAHFSQFCESRRERFPLVFYGHADAELARADFRAFALRVMERASSEDQTLARAYAAAGDPPDPAAFDDRSVPFAVASLAYSRAVTEVVRAWLTSWTQADGDLGRTPYREPVAPAAGRP